MEIIFSGGFRNNFQMDRLKIQEGSAHRVHLQLWQRKPLIYVQTDAKRITRIYRFTVTSFLHAFYKGLLFTNIRDWKIDYKHPIHLQDQIIYA